MEREKGMRAGALGWKEMRMDCSWRGAGNMRAGRGCRCGPRSHMQEEFGPS